MFTECIINIVTMVKRHCEHCHGLAYTAGDFNPGETFLVEMYESDFDDTDGIVQATDRKLLIGITESFLEERDVSTALVGCLYPLYKSAYLFVVCVHVYVCHLHAHVYIGC